MSILQQVRNNMPRILRTIADEAAVASGMLRRKRKLTGSALAEILVFGWLENPEASYHQLAETASTLGINVSRQVPIAQRLTPETAEMLKTTLDAAIADVIEIAAEPQALPLLEHFKGVFVQDSTWLSLPDELNATWQGPRKKKHPKKSALKLHLRFDIFTGGFEHFQLTDGITADSTVEKQFHQLPPGSLRLADLGYFSLDELEKLTENRVYWITRLKAGCHLFDAAGEALSLDNLLNADPENTVIRKLSVSGKQSNSTHISSQRDSLKQKQTNDGDTSDIAQNEKMKILEKHDSASQGSTSTSPTSKNTVSPRSRYA